MPGDSVDIDAWRAQLAAHVRGRKVILGPGPLAGFTAQVQRLLEDGAQRPLVVANGLGTGDLPAAGDADRVLVDLADASSLSTAIRAEQALLDDLPPQVVAAIEAYDPDREAVWLGHAFVRRTEVLGRPVLGGRPARWAALEDKTVCDALFDAAGVRRAPSELVPVEETALREAAARLDRGEGTVWAGDSSAGVNGGGEYVRWVRSSAHARAAVALLATECRLVRVAPFLDGVPCSVHGIVMPDGVVAGRPVELLTLRRPGGSAFVYAGMSTWWDPPAADREAMRDAVRRVGAHLAEEVGYAGAFGLDGVLTPDGWLPTELNARFTGGLGLVARSRPDLPLGPLQRALVAGHPPGISASELEALLLTAADSGRSGTPHGFSGRVRPEATVEIPVAGGPGGLRTAADGDAAVGTLQLGPAAVGGLVRFTPEDAAVRPGESLAPWAVAALALADRLWGTGFGPTCAAPDVRTGGPVR